jgi:serine-threonine kinase receptor-associated protein
VWSCVLDPTATLAATASADFSAKVWDALTGAEKLSFQHGHIVRCAGFADGSTRLATGGMEKLLRVYDLERPDAPPRQLAGAAKGIRGLAWINGDAAILTSQQDTAGLDVWDLRTGDVVRTLATDAPVSSIDLTFDGRHLTTTDGQTVRFWDVASLSEVKSYKVSYPVEAASYCPARGRFVCGGGDMWVRLHDYSDGSELECNRGHHGPVHTVRFGPEGKEFASGSEDGTIRLWQTS